MAGPLVTKRPNRKHYYARIDGRYVSTGHTDQRLAMDAARRMHAVGVSAYKQGKRSLAESLPDLIDEHLDFLRVEDGRGTEHLRKKRTQLMAPISAGIFRKIKDVTKQACEEWLASLSCGPKTRNEYLTAWNVFLDWLVHKDRLDSNPIKGRIRRARIKPEHRQKRRGLTLDEVSALLAVAGRRELLYLAAIGTGARFNELRQLLWCDVHESATDPNVVLRAETTKNRKGRTQSISVELAKALAAARPLAMSPRVFRRMPSHHTVEKDLRAAGIVKRTEDGVASFHSLRHTFTTIVARQTKDLRLAQRLADHADITTTQRYLHTERDERAAVMREFPTLRATRRATDVVQTGLSTTKQDSPRLALSRVQVPENEALRPLVTEHDVRCLRMEPGGIEPPCRDSQIDASTRVVTLLSRTAGGE